MADEAILDILRRIERRIAAMEPHVAGIPLIGEAIATVQREQRLLRAAVTVLEGDQ